jgi:hypothetical protein
VETSSEPSLRFFIASPRSCALGADAELALHAELRLGVDGALGQGACRPAWRLGPFTSSRRAANLLTRQQESEDGGQREQTTPAGRDAARPKESKPALLH